MKPLISVIIPVYQVEPYLRRAVDSVLNQTYRNLDIILVDDGSTDRCPKICDEYAASEARVRVVHKENGGLSDARNAGLDVAGGDYIAFLDSDDYYAPGFIEVLYDALIKHNAQVAQCSYVETGPGAALGDPKDLFEEATKNYFGGISREVVCSKQELLENQYDTICEDATYYIVAWNKLYDARLWKEIRYPKGRIHEDEATTYKIFDQCEKGVYVRIPLYAYFSSAGSITRDKFKVKRLDWMAALTDRIAYFEQKGYVRPMIAALRARADGSIKYYYPLVRHVKDCGKQKKMLKGFVREALNSKAGSPEERAEFLSARVKTGYRIFLTSPQMYRKMLKKMQARAEK